MLQNEYSTNELQQLCERYFISRLSLFGSTVHGDARPDSDLDVLVEFIPGHIPGFDFVQIQDDLTELFKQQVDLHTPKSLSHYFRDQVLKEAIPVYGKT